MADFFSAVFCFCWPRFIDSNHHSELNFKVLIRRAVPGKASGTKLNPQTSPTELLQWLATKSMAQICTDMHTYLASLQHMFFQKCSLTYSYSHWTHSVSWNPHPLCHQLLLHQVSLTLRWHFCWGCDNVASCRQWPWSNHSYVIADRVPNPVVSGHTQFLEKLKCLTQNSFVFHSDSGMVKSRYHTISI